MPTAAASITGYISLYQAPGEGAPLETQLTLRNQNDIEGGTGGAFSAVYNFSNITGSSGTTDPTTPPKTDGLTFSNFTAVGVSANSSAAGRFSFSGWPVGATNGQDNFTGAIDPAKYYEVTITPAAGKKLDLNRIAFTFQRSGTGVRQAVVRSDIDNYAANLPTAIDPLNDNLSVVGENIFQVADAATTAQEGCVIALGTAYTNLMTAVTFRFYGFNAESNAGTFSIDNVKFEG